MKTFSFSILLVGALLICVPPGAWAQADKPADVRLLIDISGSMKQNDPADLRKPAVDLLLQMLPDNSKAGVWTFGRQVNMLVRHQVVDDAWRDDAKRKAAEIGSTGLYTNIGGALENATYDADKANPAYDRNIILLTDGMVDIDKDPAKNQQEWQRIVDDVLPTLKQAGFRIHTVALSDKADTELLNRLSLATNGHASVADNADALMSTLVQAFDVAAPVEQVPLDKQGFVIDSSIEEFTALIFRVPGGKVTALVGPDQGTIDRTTVSPDVKWHSTDNYDLITVSRPLEGQWQLSAEPLPNSRVTVVSNLNLRVTSFPANVLKGQSFGLGFFLQENAAPVTQSEFLSLMTISAQLARAPDGQPADVLWQTQVSTSPPPSDGKFSVTLPPLDLAGEYEFSLALDGKSFTRGFKRRFTVRPPFSAKIVEAFDEGEIHHVLIAEASGEQVDATKVQVVATLIAPDGRKKIRPLNVTETGSWRTRLRPDMEGQYIVNVRAKGENAAGDILEQTLPPIEFVYSASAGIVEQSTSPEPSPLPSVEPTVDESAVEENPALPAWLLYVGLAVGNVILLVLGYFAFRMIMKSEPKAESKTEDGSDEAAVPEQEAPIETPDEAAVELSDDEPVMEDLEAAEEPAMMDLMDNASEPAMTELSESTEETPLDEPPMEDLTTASPAPVADTQPLVEETETLAASESSVPETSTPEAAVSEKDIPDEGEREASESAEDVVTERVDEAPATITTAQAEAPDPELGGMSAETEAGSDEPLADDAGEQSEEEEDMATAMLRAQGLDLAEDELDEAISSLIDELENEDPGPDNDGDDADNREDLTSGVNRP